MTVVNLAVDYGWGPHTLLIIFIVTVLVTTIGFFIVMATTKSKNKQSLYQNQNIIQRLFGLLALL